MLWTLQFYICREMGKTFLLTAIGLMVVLGLGGGIMNMIELDQVTAWQMLKLMGFVLPVALALTLPIAALYSAATTYGRLSADNEFVACRGSGVNILRLLAPPLAISLLSAVITFVFISFIIPGLIKNLNRLIRSDVEQLVVQGLKKPGGFALGRDRYRLFAEDSIIQIGTNGHAAKSVRLEGVTFMETDGDEWERSGSAETVVLTFDTEHSSPRVVADMYGLSLFGHKDNQSVEMRDHLRLGPGVIPRHLGMKIKWLNLRELLFYRKRPFEWLRLTEQLDRLRALACGLRFYQALVDDLAGDGSAGLGDEFVSFQIRADKPWQDPNDGRVHLEGHVQIVETTDRGERVIAADRAVIIADPGQELANARAYIELFDNVVLPDPADTNEIIRKPRAKLIAFRIDPATVSDMKARSAEDLLGDSTIFIPGTDAAKARNRVAELRDKIIRDIDGVMHSRLAFSVSVFALVILAAALGIIFRGAHVLTAFGIAFIPTLLVIVTIVAGRQLAEKPDTVNLGLAILWSGNVMVAALDAWVLLRVLRR